MDENLPAWHVEATQLADPDAPDEYVPPKETFAPFHPPVTNYEWRLLMRMPEKKKLGVARFWQPVLVKIAFPQAGERCNMVSGYTPVHVPYGAATQTSVGGYNTTGGPASYQALNVGGYNPAGGPSYQPQNVPAQSPQSVPSYQSQSVPGYPPQNVPGYQPQIASGFQPPDAAPYQQSDVGYRASNAAGNQASVDPAAQAGGAAGYNPATNPFASAPMQTQAAAPTLAFTLPAEKPKPVIRIFFNDQDPRPSREYPLESNLQLSRHVLQQYDQAGKLHVVKMQQVTYKEMVGMKAEKFMSFKTLQTLITKPKGTHALDHIPQETS